MLGMPTTKAAAKFTTFKIDKAASTITVTCTAGPSTYTGLAKTLHRHSNGSRGLERKSTVIYSNNTVAGTATASASYAGDANHEASSDTETFTIDKAASTTTVTCTAGPFDTRLSSHTLHRNSNGCRGLSETLTVNYSDNTVCRDSDRQCKLCWGCQPRSQQRH